MKKILSMFLVIALSFSLVACGGNGGSDDVSKEDGASVLENNDEIEGDTIVIGGLAPLTGGVSQYGIATNNGALLAVKEINENGGILGKQIEYIVQDEQGDITEAINAYNKLYQSDKIVALVGDVTTKPTIAVAQKVARDGIPMITATATGQAVTEAGENIFRACFIDPYQGQLMANYAFDKLEAKTAAIIFDSGDDYSTGVAEAFKAEAEKLGIEVVNFEGYASGIDDFNAQLIKIKKSNPDVIMAPVYYDDASKIVTQARKIEITAPFLGSDGWDGVAEKLDEGSRDILDGSFYCSQYSRQSEDARLQNFIKTYNETYGISENMFAVLGYDAMMMMAKAIEAAGTTDADAVVAAMKTLEYDGLTGVTVFDKNRNPVRQAYITTFEAGESKVHEVYSFTSEEEEK